MAQTLKFGNGTWATKKGSTLAYNDEDGNYKPLPFTYTGAGKGTRVNKEGLIEVVENDRPRIDYLDSEDGVFLLEKASTNLVTYSEDFSNAAWTKTGATTVASNTVISPDGNLNGSTISGLTGSGSNDIYFITGVNPASKTYCASVYLKGEGTLRLQTSNNVNQGISKTITLTSNWKRHSVIGTFNSTSGNLSVTIDDTTATATQFDIWGAMLEENSIASSYIPTQGTIQTRVAETASGSGNSEVFNSSEGVLFVEMSASDNNSRISLSDGSTSNRVSFKITDDNIDFQYRVGGNYSYRVNVDVNNYLNNKILMSYNNGLFVGYLNGFPISNKISGVSLADGVVNRLNLNDGDASDGFKGRIKEIGYYDEILTDEELEYMTSYRSLSEMLKELNIKAL